METTQYKIMRQVEDTHFWYVGMRAITSSLLDSLPLPPNASILDAGCGTGGNLQFLARYGQVTGIDISDVAVKHCARRGIKNILQGSIDALPFKNNSFDLIICFDVLGHHLVNQTKAMSEFFRVLKPGGVLLIRVAAYPWLHSRHDYVVQNARRYSKSSLRHLAVAAGLTNTRYTYANTFLFPLIAFWRMFALIFARPHQHHSDTWAIPPILNSILTLPLKLEASLLNYINLPFGLSLIALVHKPRGKHAILA